MRVRVNPRMADKFPRFRRVGRVFTPEWQEFHQNEITPTQLEFLTGPESTRFLEVEGAPERKGAAAPSSSPKASDTTTGGEHGAGDTPPSKPKGAAKA